MSPCRLSLIDADAFILSRRFGLFTLLKQRSFEAPLLLSTGRIARNELSDLADEVAELEARGLLAVHEVVARTPVAIRAREFKRDLDRGEAEALAWLVETRGSDDYPVFISFDQKAKKFASRLGIPVGDTLDMAMMWCSCALIGQTDIENCFADWESAPQGQLWRPSGLTTIGDEIERRRTRPPHIDPPAYRARE